MKGYEFILPFLFFFICLLSLWFRFEFTLLSSVDVVLCNLFSTLFVVTLLPIPHCYWSFFILINLSFIFFHLVALCFYSPLFSSHLKYFFPLVLFTMKLLSNEFPIT